MDAAPLSRSPLADLAETAVILLLVVEVARLTVALESERPPEAAFLSDCEVASADRGLRTAEFAAETHILRDDGEPSSETPGGSVSLLFDAVSDCAVPSEIRDPITAIAEPATDPEKPTPDEPEPSGDAFDGCAEEPEATIPRCSPCFRGELDLAQIREIARQAKALHESLIALLQSLGAE